MALILASIYENSESNAHYGEVMDYLSLCRLLRKEGGEHSTKSPFYITSPQVARREN